MGTALSEPLPFVEQVPITASRLSVALQAAQVVGVGEEKGQEARTDELVAQGIGSVTLFASALADPVAAARRTTELQRRAQHGPVGVPLLISVDEEGGAVTRLPLGRTTLPSAMALGRVATRQGLSEATRLAKTAARAVAGRLLALGIQWNLAPVCDLHLMDNPALGSRSFSSDAEEAGTLAAAFAQGLAEGGVIAVAKHFPGHGATSVDSHQALPVLAADRAMLEGREFVPFRATIAAGIPAIMTGHLGVPALDPSGTPASLSPFVYETIRGALGFRGLMVTDSLGMAGAAVAGGVGAAAVQALRAGADLVLVAHGPEEQREVLRAIVRAVETGELPARRLAAACDQVLALKRRQALARRPVPDEEAAPHLLDRPSDALLAAEIASTAVVASGGPEVWVPAGGEHVLLVHAGPSALLEASRKQWPRAVAVTAGSERPEPGDLVVLLAAGGTMPSHATVECLKPSAERAVAAGLRVLWLWTGARWHSGMIERQPVLSACDSTPASLQALLALAERPGRRPEGV